jgi:hypothetical protein
MVRRTAGGEGASGIDLKAATGVSTATAASPAAAIVETSNTDRQIASLQLCAVIRCLQAGPAMTAV